MNLWLLKRTIKQSCLVVALLFMGLGIGFSSIKAEEPPTIHFDATNHNYGVIAEDKGEAIHQFIFRNEGNSPLVILA